MLNLKVRKRAKIRNCYNQAQHLTQDTNGKMTTSQLDITNESQISFIVYLVECAHKLENGFIFYHMGLVVRKPVFGVSDKASFKQVSSATETS